jgi:hypothetical protein
VALWTDLLEDLLATFTGERAAVFLADDFAGFLIVLLAAVLVDAVARVFFVVLAAAFAPVFFFTAFLVLLDFAMMAIPICTSFDSGCFSSRELTFSSSARFAG